MVDSPRKALVEVQAASRRFGARTALKGVDLTVAPGEIFGLIGPNGSGKSTLLRMLAGMLRPTTGSVRVFGLDPFHDRTELMRRARFAFAPPALYENLTAREHLRHVATVTPGEADAALDTVGLRDRADDRVATFSFGMRQRLLLALALSPMPELLVLDEPTDGLDPLAVLELRAVLARLRRDHGVAVLLASHLLVEIEELVDQVLVLHEGQPLLQGVPRTLTGARRRLRLAMTDAARGREALSLHGVDKADALDAHTLELAPDSVDLRSADRVLAAAGVDLQAFAITTPSLETLVLEALRDAATS